MRLAPFVLVLGAVFAVEETAQAAGLRAGGALAGGSEERLAAAGKASFVADAFYQGLPVAELRFGFTPRTGGSLLVNAAEAPDASLGLQLGLAAGTGGFGRLNELGLVPRLPSPEADTASSGLVVGGALAWAGWTIGGSYSFGALPGASLDLWTGQVGYGPVTARLGYGQEVAVGRLERQLWLFGTDVATWSWLTLEGDVAVTAQPDREPTTVGRIGLRLNF